MKTTPKFERMAQIYRHFGREFATSLDWSDDAKYRMFKFESEGIGTKSELIEERNGFLEGKRLMNITVAMWQEDLTAHDRGEPRLLFSFELYMQYPKWFVDICIPKRFHLSEQEIANLQNADLARLYPLGKVNAFL
jgi:hypothetical protein